MSVVFTHCCMCDFNHVIQVLAYMDMQCVLYKGIILDKACSDAVEMEAS